MYSYISSICVSLLKKDTKMADTNFTMANQAGGAILGLGSTMVGNALGLGNAQDLQALQIAGQKELAQYNQELALDMWNKTNYSAQRKHMEKAGLNVGLMYGKGGGGGATTASNPGNVSGQQANNKSGMLEGMAMMLQQEATKANIEVARTQAEKNKAEAKEVEARTPTYAKGMERTDAEIKEIATKLGVNEAQAKKILQDIEGSKSGIEVNKANIEKLEAETNRINTLTPLDADSTKQEIKRQITTNAYLDRKERAELDNLLQDVLNKRNQIKQSLNEVEIKKFSEEMKADYPSLFNVGGRAVDGIIRGISRLLGNGQDDNLKRRINTK